MACNGKFGAEWEDRPTARFAIQPAPRVSLHIPCSISRHSMFCTMQMQARFKGRWASLLIRLPQCKQPSAADSFDYLIRPSRTTSGERTHVGQRTCRMWRVQQTREREKRVSWRSATKRRQAPGPLELFISKYFSLSFSLSLLVTATVCLVRVPSLPASLTELHYLLHLTSSRG